MAEAPEGNGVVLPDLPTLGVSSDLMETLFSAMLGAVPDSLRADHRYLWLYVHLVRMLDKAISEYDGAGKAWARAEALTEQDWIRKFNDLLAGAHHIENCVDATHRAVTAATLLRNKCFGVSFSAPNSGAILRLNNIRDAMQHTPERLLDKDLRPGRLPFRIDQGDPYAISPRKHELAIGQEAPLTYTELVALIEWCDLAARAVGRSPAPKRS